MIKSLNPIIKEYPSRGPLQQFRVESATAFCCFRCNQDKKSKLLTIYKGVSDKFLCNGCYGQLLSIYAIKEGTQSNDDKAGHLAEILLSFLSEHQIQQASEKVLISENRAQLLSKSSLKYLATADYVAKKLDNSANLDWSPAVIGLCKAIEVELIQRFIEPLRVICVNHDLSMDLQDPDLGRVVKYCSGKSSVPPEVGAIIRFLETAAHSRERIHNSSILQLLKTLLSCWPQSGWLIDGSGAIKMFQTLIIKFRNRAAHIEDLSKFDYDQCFDLVSGKEGLLWNLIAATQKKRAH